MSEFELGPEQPPEIVVMDETGFDPEFPLAVSVDREACGAFLLSCGVAAAEVAAVSVSVTSKGRGVMQVVDKNHALGRLLFVDSNALERNVTLFGGSVMQAIINASHSRTQIPLSTVQKRVNRDFGVALSCCADELTIGFEGVMKEIHEAKKAMRHEAIAKRFTLAFGGSVTAGALTEAFTHSLLAGGVASATLAGVSVFEVQSFLRTQYAATDITENWPYQKRAKRRVADLIEVPERPLVTFDWRPNL